MALGFLAGLAAAGAAVATPTGFAAVGVWLGVVDPPWIVSAAPVLGWLATAAGSLSGVTFFFAKWQKSRQSRQTASSESEQ